jgi:PAS domain S-box-containing protein
VTLEAVGEGVVSEARASARQVAFALTEVQRQAMIDHGERVRQLDDPIELGHASAEIVGRTLGARRAGYASVDPGAFLIILPRDWAAEGLASLAGMHDARRYGPCIQTLARGEIVVRADTSAADAAEECRFLEVEQPASVMLMPMTEQGRLVGFFFVVGEPGRTWTGDELTFLRAVAENTHAAVRRRRAEDELRSLAASLERQVEQRTRERDVLWELSEDLLLVADYEGRLVRISPSWTRALGYDEATLLSRPYGEIVHPDDLVRSIQALYRMRDTGESIRLEDRVRDINGNWRWLSWSFNPAPGGKRFFGIGRDVTEARAAADALRRSEARLRSIFATSYQYQGMMSVDGILLETNAASLKGIHARPEDVIGRPFWETPWFTDTPGMPERVREVIPRVAAGETIRSEIRVHLPEDGWRWFDFTLRPVRDDAGEVVGIVPEAMEITERRRAEEALRQSQKLEAMGQLTGGVAHDFNNLLTPITGALDMLQRSTGLSAREMRLVEAALQSADRARILVQRLLAFARRQPLQTTAVDIKALVGGMGELITSTSGPQVRVVVDAEADLPAARADANQLEMAILNLSVNARDAMPDGGTLTISASAETIERGERDDLDPGRYVRIAVADTGVGMDETTAARAVEPFFSTKGHGKGTGLGLSMAHGLASQLGGALEISSLPGLGTKISLWLPATTAPVAAEAAEAPAVGAHAAAGTALLVDDEEGVRISTAEMLAELGYAVVEAPSADEAMRMVEQGLGFDLLVTDHLMPGMTGVDLARAVRERRPEAPVLIVSGFAESEALAPDLPRLAKPFRKAELSAVLQGLNRL